MGSLYFYGLWWTVRQMIDNQHPYRLMLLSFVIRSVLVMGGFYLLLLWGWQILAIGLLGFIAARMVVVKNWGLKNINLNKSLEKSDGV